MKQGKNYNWLALLGMFVVVILVIYALSVFGDEPKESLDTSTDEVGDEIEAKEEYTPKLKEIENSEAERDDNVGENDQEEIRIEDGSTTSDSFSSTDASLEENKNSSTTYEEFKEANFDEKD